MHKNDSLVYHVYPQNHQVKYKLLQEIKKSSKDHDGSRSQIESCLKGVHWILRS